MSDTKLNTKYADIFLSKLSSLIVFKNTNSLS